MLFEAAPLSRCLSQQSGVMAKFEKRLIDSPNKSKSYELWDELGKGMHANVFRGKNMTDGKFYAMKISKHTRLKKKRDEHNSALLNEAAILKNLDHENVIKCFEVFEFSSQIIVVLELIEGGELFQYLALHESISELECITFAKQICEGISHFHSRNIAHLDLKPENIMIKNLQTKQLVIVDFSLSRVINKNDKIKLMHGTVEFSAPEIFNYELIGFYTDMWAFGVILYILLTGLSPFLADNDNETQSNVCQVDVPYEIDQLKHISTHAIDLMKALLVKDTKKRLTADQCLQHRWFRVPKQLRNRSVSMIATSGFKKFLSINAQNSINPPEIHKIEFNESPGTSNSPITNNVFAKPVLCGSTALTRTKSF